VDFIAPKGFAVFNLADSAIVTAAVLMVLLSARGLSYDGTRVGAADPPPDPPAETPKNSG
jgi:signal peptidase II